MTGKFKRGIYKIITLSSLVLAPLAITISCGKDENTVKNNAILSNKDENLVIATAIPKTWPQYAGLINIIKDYNENHNKEDNFMKVIFKSNEDTKTEAGDYDGLSSQINKLVSLNSKNVPNMIIANFSEAYELSGYGKLMNLENENGIRRSIFDNKFVANRTKLKATNYADGLWAVPITVTTNSSPVFNMPIMKKILTLMKNHGATVDITNNPFMQAIMSDNNNIDAYKDSKPKAYKENPSDLWKDLSATPVAKDLKGYEISDNTFTTLEGLYKFSIKATQSLKLKQAPYIVGTYFMNDFLTALDSEAGATNALFPLYKAKIAGKGFDFPFLTPGSTAEGQLKTAFEQLLEPMKKHALAIPEKFNVESIRNGQYAISTMPAVSARYSYKNRTFGAYADNGFAFEDIYYLPQMSQYSSAGAGSSYSLAESSLLGIKTTAAKDKAVLKFINFIYQGKMKDKTRVADYLEQSSGYVIPLKEKTTPAAIESIRTKYKALKNDGTDKEHAKGAVYRSLLNTYQSINNGQYRTLDGDQYTSKLLVIIKKILNTVVEKPNDWNANKFIEEIKKHESEFKI